MAKRPDLSKLTDEQYKAMSPEALLDYNKELPQQDYDKPYSAADHPYPRMKFAVVEVDGKQRLRTATVKSKAEEDALPEGFADSPAAFGIETAPGAPLVQTEDFDIEIPQRDGEATEHAATL